MTKIGAKKTTHSQLKRSQYLQLIRWKQLQRNRKDGVLDELCCYLGPTKEKNTKKIWWSSEHSVTTGGQQKCDTISGRIRCLPPNRANNIENIEDKIMYNFHLYFDNDIMDKTAEYKNTRINETIVRLQRSDNFNESSQYT